ncbi:type II secretion system F family protein [Quisquiliibacterium transsilvanicum]|uniref:Tight adherence protein C n=1 Tax=Quisquiliibacterium transsilvanicum TaxID=1549638 RepID=A0A7W8HGZ2_9BURK|nr:type II secretion system F family protein [Quisquiliibacterium transsilvanicum]MBB5271050.1 tight adherence protein C [Quisquiliibacterium transsilvanicum]
MPPDMPLPQIAILAMVFLAASGLAVGLFLLLRRSETSRRLERVVTGATPTLVKEPSQSGWVESVVKLASPLARLSIPDEGWEQSEIRRRLMHAGLRSASAPVVFFGVKTFLGLALPLVGWFAITMAGKDMGASRLVILLTLLMGMGYYLPNLVLNRIVKLRQRELFEAFPDALDLLTICVEAGLGLDAALARVASEMQLKSEVLADELQLVVLEMRAGGGKERALRNLALRTGVEDIDTLVAMLIQSEKFGTSIGDALRIHSDMLRSKRQQRAEEAAAKVAVKLIFPLVLCIFPSILIVVAGPAVLRIGKLLSTFGQ